MFTPQRKPFPAIERKGKVVASADEITTPKGLNNGRFGAALVVDDWQKFTEVGLLDEASLERKDRDALLEKILKLEKELFDYQHNMGLLLIEKKQWTSTNEELQQAFDEANEILKRERSSSLIALNEAEKREENLRKALISEKLFVAELERDLKYLRQEHSEVKSTSEAKLAEANALVIGIKESALEVDKKRAIAEEKVSAINRKSSELERKLKDMETREKVVQREHLSLVTEREAHEAVFHKQKEDLQEWENKLTVEEERLSEAKRSVMHIDERATESERTIKKRERDLKEIQRKIDIAKSELTEREEALNIMIKDISMKEKDFEAMKTKVAMKEKELHELEEKLIVREQMEIRKLLDDQKAVLDSRRQEFEMELEQMRISLDEEHQKRKCEIEQLQVEIGHKGEQLRKREAALEEMVERVKEKEKDLEARMKAVKEKEKSLKAEEKKLHMENARFLEDKESLRKLKVEIEEIGAETTKQEARMREEHESLRITKEERLEFLRLQSELKQHIDRVKQEEELLLKKCEELRQDKERFEKEWEALDEKKADITRVQNEISEEKEKLRSLEISEKHELDREEMSFNDILKREREEISVQKKKLEKQSVELRKDVNEVDELRISLKKQQEELCCEKKRFVAILKKIKICNSCGEKFGKSFWSDLLPEIEDGDGDKLSGKEEAFNTSLSAENNRSTTLFWKLASVKLPESLQPDDTLDTVAGDDCEPSATEQSFTDSRIQEGPEVSLQSEIKSDKPRRGRGRSKSGRGRSQATRAACRDTKPSVGGTPRKRQREQASRITGSEHAAGDSDEDVDSITTGGRSKKRQATIQVSQTPGQSRYHLRRHRNVGIEDDKAQASTSGMEKQESVNVDVRAVPSLKDNPLQAKGENTENGKTETLVQAVKNEEVAKVEVETGFKDNNMGKKPVKDPQLEAGGSCEDDDRNFSMIEEEKEEEEEEEEEEERESPGDASIGKKIWVFFTT